eukprot:scaffold117167_cov33-Phaeocystis_antarctica.AAC.1
MSSTRAPTPLVASRIWPMEHLRLALPLRAPHGTRGTARLNEGGLSSCCDCPVSNPRLSPPVNVSPRD